MAFLLNGGGNPLGIAAIFPVCPYKRMENRKFARPLHCGNRAGKEEQRLEKKISLLFDFQKFEKNADLQAVIDAVHARYSARKLTDDEAEWVAAAGTPGTSLLNSQQKDKWK